MTHTVRYCAQMPRVLTQILVQRYWNLCYFKAGICKTADHFCGKFHATALKFGFHGCCTVQTSQTAVEIHNIHLVAAPAQPWIIAYSKWIRLEVAA